MPNNNWKAASVALIIVTSLFVYWNIREDVSITSVTDYGLPAILKTNDSNNNYAYLP